MTRKDEAEAKKHLLHYGKIMAIIISELYVQSQFDLRTKIYTAQLNTDRKQ